jgi:hypothetical protein
MLKHIGRLKHNQRKVIVAYKTLPDDPEHCVCVTTESLEAADHDFVMQLVESNSGQATDEFAEAMARSTLSDGSNMLNNFHHTGRMSRYNTKDVEMTPDTQTVISLDELNRMIADQKGVAIEDLALSNPSKKRKPAEAAKAPSKPVAETPVAEAPVTPLQAPTDGVITDEQLASNYRSQADRLFKEAKQLREQAEQLSPTKKRRKIAKKSVEEVQ